MKLLANFFFIIAVISTVLGCGLALMGLWGHIPVDEIFWKYMITCGIFSLCFTMLNLLSKDNSS